MNPNLTLSVIVPNYNHADYLEQRITSILEQTYQDFELILMDDTSKDNSLRILEKYRGHPKVSKLIINKKNSGSPFRQWYKGMVQARGEYIWIAESDDFSDKGFAETLMKLLLARPSLSLAYTQSMDVDERGEVQRSRLYWTEEFRPNIWEDSFCIEGNTLLNAYLPFKNVIPNASAVIFSKEAFLNSYDPVAEQMKMLGDWLLWAGLMANRNIGFVTKPFNYFRHHHSSSRVHNTSQKKRQRLREEAMVLEKIKSTGAIDKTLYKSRQQYLLTRWFRQFHKYVGFTEPGFYELCKYTDISTVGMLIAMATGLMNQKK